MPNLRGRTAETAFSGTESEPLPSARLLPAPRASSWSYSQGLGASTERRQHGALQSLSASRSSYETMGPGGFLWVFWDHQDRSTTLPSGSQCTEGAARSSQGPQAGGRQGRLGQAPRGPKEAPRGPVRGLGDQGRSRVTVPGSQKGSEQGTGNVLQDDILGPVFTKATGYVMAKNRLGVLARTETRGSPQALTDHHAQGCAHTRPVRSVCMYAKSHH